MRFRTRLWAILLVAAAGILAALARGLGPAADVSRTASAVAPTAGGLYHEIEWVDLIPGDWDPIKRFKRRNLVNLDDGSRRAEELQRQMRALWDNAPTVSALDGAAVKLAGYVVPLEEADGALTEFLLVPYFGACIHTPPPPANQIVAVSGSAARGLRAMDTVRVSGRMSTVRQDSAMGASGYRLRAAAVEPYAPLAGR